MEARPVRIYSLEDSPRLRYIAQIILGDILGLKWEITSDRRKLGKNPVINYSVTDIPGSFRINPVSLLFEKGIMHRDIDVTHWNGLPVFFTSDGATDLPFDIFAASFWLVSRYEEYLDHEKDEHGRFRMTSSLAYRHGFLGLPVVDLWVREFSMALLRKFRTISFRRSEFRAVVTIDADESFAHPGRNIFRSIGGLLHEHRSDPGQEKDPYDVFDYIQAEIFSQEAEARFFFPVGDRSKYDKNPSWKHQEYRNLIESVSRKFMTGLHPSYHSARKPELILSEKKRLDSITGKPSTASRFHYLRFSLPGSYCELIACGIKEDYSMGYTEEPGFRAGISRPFKFFDLDTDSESDLTIQSFQLMDETLTRLLNSSPEESKLMVKKMIDVTRKAGGTFVSIWHNTTLLRDEKHEVWRDLFKFMLSYQGNDSIS